MNSRLLFLAASFVGIAVLYQSQEIGDWTDSYVKNLAPTKWLRGYSRDNGTLHQRQYYDRSMETGAGGIYTTAEDMLLWNKALDSPGLLSATSLQMMFTPHPPGNYGSGWFVETSPRRKIFHEGGDPGFAAFEVRYPDQHLVIVVLANEDDSPVREIGDAIAHRILGD
jgi:CubicO group peptidase (beta-lactamase class C family)